MHINYKEPYWMKFKWDMSSHHENQYVTEFNKHNNDLLDDIFHKEKFVLTISFSIKKDYQKDEVCMVFGKPGKNIGLSYNQKTQTCAFEFWTKKENEEDKFKMVVLKSVLNNDIENGVTISVVKNGNVLKFYKNFIFDVEHILEDDFIDDYKTSGLFIGASYPQSDIENNRYYCEFDIFHLSYIVDSSEINDITNIYDKNTKDLVNIRYYENILFYYDFKTINNIGIIYDESKYTNFLERTPKELIK